MGLADHRYWLAFKAETGAGFARNGRQFQRYIANQRVQMRRLELWHVAAIGLQARERRQLLHAVRGLACGAVQRFKMASNAFAIGLAQGELGLRLSHNQRHLQLMCDIGKEAFTGMHQAQQADRMLTDSLDQQGYFCKQALLRQRGKFIDTMTGRSFIQLPQRSKAAPYAPPDDADGQYYEQHFLLQ